MGRRVLVLACIRTVATFLVGFAIGAIFNLLLSSSLQLPTHDLAPALDDQWETKYEDVLRAESQRDEDTREARQPSPLSPILPRREELPETPRLLCFVLAGPTTHRTAVHVKNTWGQRCDRLVFYSTEDDVSLKPEVLDVPEGYGYLWAKTKAALAHLHHHYPHYHWYLKADDDTYVIVENLRYFLQGRDPDLPVHYGVKFRQHVKQGYMSGGGGYVLSREALRKFVTEALAITDQTKCATQSTRGAEDMQLGKCLESIGVAAADSLDDMGRSRFFTHSPLSLFFKQPVINKLHWYWRYIWHPHTVGPDCCSRHIVSFHDINPRMMWVLESLLYRIHIHRDLQPPGLNTSTSTLPPSFTSTSNDAVLVESISNSTLSSTTSTTVSSQDTTPQESHPERTE